MRITKASTKKRWVAILAAVGIIFLSGAGAYALQQLNNESSDTVNDRVNNDQITKDVDYSSPTDEEIQSGKETKEQTVDHNKNERPSTNDVDITAYNTGTIIQIRSNLTDNAQDGSCELSLTNGNTSVSKDVVGIQALSGYSTCKGWDVPVSELSSGTWTISVKVSYQSKISTGATRVTIP